MQSANVASQKAGSIFKLMPIAGAVGPTIGAHFHLDIVQTHAIEHRLPIP
jgi:hypothetical protein